MLSGDTCRRILIIRLSAIGDVVMATPLAKALREAFPDAYIAWVVEAKSKDMLEGNPYLDEVIVWQRKYTGRSILHRAARYIAGLRKLSRELKARNFDVAIDVQGLMRSAVIARVSGARLRIGFNNAREGASLFHHVHLRMARVVRHGDELYIEMLRLLGVTVDKLEMHVPVADEAQAFAREFIAQARAAHPSARRVVALCPATTWPQKYWTEQGWAEVADTLATRYNALPIFLGSKEDIPLMDRVTGLMTTDPVSAIGGTTLKQASALIAQSDLVIAVDTGLLHIANALKRPIVGIFGPTTWDYLGKKDTLRIVAKELGCMPCFRHPSCERFDCMREITADDVLTAVERWLD
jgi:heptosyltransferase I